MHPRFPLDSPMCTMGTTNAQEKHTNVHVHFYLHITPAKTHTPRTGEKKERFRIAKTMSVRSTHVFNPRTCMIYIYICMYTRTINTRFLLLKYERERVFCVSDDTAPPAPPHERKQMAAYPLGICVCGRLNLCMLCLCTLDCIASCCRYMCKMFSL